MGSLSGQAWQWVASLVGAVIALVGAYFVLPKLIKTLKGLGGRIVLALMIVICLVVVISLSRRYPSSSLPDSSLPSLFRDSYWVWMFLFVVGAIVSTFTLVQASATRRDGAGTRETAWPDLDAAWEEILVRLRQAKIEPANQRFYLVIAPDEERAAEPVRAAGAPIYVEAPEGPAPVHAFATSDAVFLSCAGASNLTSGAESPGSRMEPLCRKLLALQPDCPVVRGVVVVFPIAWASQAESVKAAAGVRDDLQAIRRVLKTRCPVVAVFSGMEWAPGFSDFVARLVAQVSPQMVDQRAGFAVPRSEPFSGDLLQRGMVWMSGWFRSWILNLLAGGSLDDRANGRLLTLDYEFRRYRKRLRALLEAAFSTHRESEAVLFRGCYFMATGAGRHERAFCAGLFRGARSRVVADHVATTWASEAEREDARYLRMALAVGSVGGLIALITWLYIASRTPLGWLGLIALVVIWFIVAIRLTRR
jgi:type VI secretion system protein ImpL